MNKKHITDTALVTAGSVIFAAAVNIFTAPNDMVLGGITGIATMANHLFNIPIGAVIIIINIPIFIAALKRLGVRYTARTLAAVLISSVIIDATAPFMPQYRGDMLITAVSAGVLSGLGLGLIFMSGATTGGSELVAAMLSAKFRHIPIGRLVFWVDSVVVAASALVYRNIEAPMYSAMIIFIMSRVLDAVLYGSSLGHGQLMLIISDKTRIIAGYIMSDMKRGATLIPSEGGYTGSKGELLMCAVRKQEVYRVCDIVYSIDKSAFVIVTEAGEIRGEGFGEKQ